MPSLKNLPSAAPNESSPYWFQGNFAASLVFNFCLREFLLSAFANRFELRCELKRLMPLYYKICPCFHAYNFWYCHEEQLLLANSLLSKNFCLQGERGAATNYISRNQALKKLQLSLPDFRLMFLCTLFLSESSCQELLNGDICYDL